MKKRSDYVILAILMIWGLSLGIWWVWTLTEHSKPTHPRIYYSEGGANVVNCEQIMPTIAEVHEAIASKVIETYEAETETQPAYTDDDILLMRIASCEAGNQGIEGMALVMCVVLNRCRATNASISEVIYAPEQFAAVHTEYWFNNYMADGCYEALELIRAGWDGSQDAMYFCTPSQNGWHRSSLEYLFTHGNHEFYR